MIREHIEEHQIGDEELLFPLWMFTYRRASTGVTTVTGEEMPAPLVSATGKVYEHGTMGARFTMNCHCVHCKAYAAWYARNAASGHGRPVHSDASAPMHGDGMGPSSSR
jgi:hypothetical protein